MSEPAMVSVPRDLKTALVEFIERCSACQTQAWYAIGNELADLKCLHQELSDRADAAAKRLTGILSDLRPGLGNPCELEEKRWIDIWVRGAEQCIVILGSKRFEQLSGFLARLKAHVAAQSAEKTTRPEPGPEEAAKMREFAEKYIGNFLSSREDVEIDENAALSVSDDGFFVACWVWVPWDVYESQDKETDDVE